MPDMNDAAHRTSISCQPLVVDTRPVFAQGGTPCSVIDDAVRQLAPGQSLVLLVPFEPVPLYSKLADLGFEHEAAEQPDGLWRVEFRRTGAASAAPLTIPRCDCAGAS
jgi:uncharacterized protein (DUF2249 family)